MSELMDMKIKQLSKYSKINKIYIENSDMCACYYCLSVFEPKEIINWIDKKETALCPKCGIDAVIGDSVSQIDTEFLEKASDYWF
jgi:hypothetical protein